MKHSASARRILIALVLTLFSVSLGLAQEVKLAESEKETAATGFAVSDLQGDWVATFSGFTGCGVSTLIIEFNLDAAGNGTQTLQAGHSDGCGDNTYTDRPVGIHFLNPDGRGEIGFDCGPPCGFVFPMQVSRNKQVFNMSAESVGGNYLAGSAVKRDKATALAVSDLQGDWTATFSGLTGCGVSTLLIHFHLDATGNGTQSLTAGHSVACGDNSYTGFIVQIQALNPDGSGFIAFECGVGCGFGFDFQVSSQQAVVQHVGAAGHRELPGGSRRPEVTFSRPREPESASSGTRASGRRRSPRLPAASRSDPSRSGRRRRRRCAPRARPWARTP